MRILSILFLMLFVQTANAQVSKSQVSDLVQYLDTRQYEKVLETVDSSLMEEVSAYEFKMAWEGMLQSLGKFIDTIDFQQENIGFKQVWNVGLAFEKDSIDLAFYFTESGKLSGFFQRSYADKQPYELPDYTKATDFVEIPFVLYSKGYRLPGILTVSAKSKSPTPLLILAHGSGANSKDEKMGPNPVFKDLAYGLASQGVSTFRYDKRSLVYGAKMCSNPDSFTVYEEVIEDILSAIDTFSQDARFKGIFVLGHSLSGYLIPRVAEKRPGLNGVISAAGPARPLHTLVLEQYNYFQSIDEDPDDWIYPIKQLQRKIEYMESEEFSYSADAESLPLNLPAAYWMDLKNYDPVKIAREAGLPVLVLQGEKDYQVLMSDFNLWKTGLKDCAKCRFISYKNLGHGFFVGADVPGGKQYNKVDHVRKDVIKDIAKFIKANRP